jgi:hypothetical protein
MPDRDILTRLRITRATLVEHSPQDRAVRDAMAEIDRLQRRELIWAASGRWCHDWITRATNLLGGLRDDLEHELAESGHLAELEQLLADDFEDGDDV